MINSIFIKKTAIYINSWFFDEVWEILKTKKASRID